MRTTFIIAATLLMLAAHTQAQAQTLESGLTDALRLKPGTTQRLGDAGKAIRAYMQAGLVPKRRNQRADYTDYYLLTAPAKFMGHDLVVIEQEYMSKYVGCCVSPGAGVSLRAVGSTNNLQRFAEANGCGFTEHVKLQEDLKNYGIGLTLPAGNYLTLSCRERDIQQP